MGFFNHEPIKRLDEEELRKIYLWSKRLEKRVSVFYMIVSGLVSIAIISYAISQKIYWILCFSVISVIAFIYLITQFSNIIEDIFENRIYEEEVEDGEETPS